MSKEDALKILNRLMRQSGQPDHFVLEDNHRFRPAESYEEWISFMEDLTRRRVALDEVSPEVHISTVFLGLDHNFGGEGGPILFESLVFGGPLDGEMRRYRTWDEAVEGHYQLVVTVKDLVGVPPQVLWDTN